MLRVVWRRLAPAVTAVTPAPPSSPSDHTRSVRVGGGLTLLSWSIDGSERAVHASRRRVPMPQRAPLIADAIADTRADVVCLQDSVGSLIAAEMSERGYRQIGDLCMNGKVGPMQSFIRVDSAWDATPLPKYPFSTFELRSLSNATSAGKDRSHRGDVVRVTNLDLSYRGKGITAGSDGMDTAPFESGRSSLSSSADVAAARDAARRYVADCIRPDIAVGNSLLGALDSFMEPEYQDVLHLCGSMAAGRTDATTDTTPGCFVMPMPAADGFRFDRQSVFDATTFLEGGKSNYFYFVEPFTAHAKLQGLVSRRGRNQLAPNHELLACLDPCDASRVGQPATETEVPKLATSVTGRYQRAFVRSNSAALRSKFHQFEVTTLFPSVPRVVEACLFSVSANRMMDTGPFQVRVPVGLSDQRPLMVIMA